MAAFAFLGVAGLVSQLLAHSQRAAAAAAEAELLRRSDEMKSTLLATVSHELGTPLAVIKAAATTLGDQARTARPNGVDDAAHLDAGTSRQPAAVVGELASSIESEADHLRRIVTDLLDVSRIERAEPSRWGSGQGPRPPQAAGPPP